METQVQLSDVDIKSKVVKKKGEEGRCKKKERVRVRVSGGVHVHFL